MLSYPVCVQKKGAVSTAKEMYNRLEQFMDSTVHAMISNRRDISRPNEAFLFETASTQNQATVTREMKAIISKVHDEYGETDVEPWGVRQRLTLIARGVPPDVSLQEIKDSNVGQLRNDTLKRLNRYVEGKPVPGNTLVMEAASDHAKTELIENGLKAGKLIFRNIQTKVAEAPVCFVCTQLGHLAKSCSAGIIEDLKINLSSLDSKDFYCYKCQKVGHRFRECKEEISPVCGNCDQDDPTYQPHWPTDFGCPTRDRLRRGEIIDRQQTWARVVGSEQSKDIQQLRVRQNDVERRLEVVEEANTIQSQAISSTRKVLTDVALVATSHKDELSSSSKHSLKAWHAMEKQLQVTRSTSDTKSKRSRTTGGPKKRPTSSLDRVTASETTSDTCNPMEEEDAEDWAYGISDDG